MLKTQMIGNIGQEPRLSETNGKWALNFSIAHNEKYKDSNGNTVEKSTWVNCTGWYDKKPAIAAYVKKGGMVYVEGKPSVRTYQNKEGQHLASLELRIEKIELLGGTGAKKEEGETGQGASAGSPSTDNSDDMPF